MYNVINFKHPQIIFMTPSDRIICWIFHAPTIRAVARVGAQPLLEDALVHLQDFLEPCEPRAHSSVYFLSLCSTFLFHVGHLSSPVCPLLSQSQGCTPTSL